eukprot:TRINITY_DN61821_c0_g1_i1.p1 TRINITY_DN61821_c0_g1~~TRINITY_DN61821_c0_g1_i1.p1  ORF type:complete len:512 (+),score=220.81 TRINITY_DN61821_c0_g1_i1:227-1537(+)
MRNVLLDMTDTKGGEMVLTKVLMLYASAAMLMVVETGRKGVRAFSLSSALVLMAWSVCFGLAFSMCCVVLPIVLFVTLPDIRARRAYAPTKCHLFQNSTGRIAAAAVYITLTIVVPTLVAMFLERGSDAWMLCYVVVAGAALPLPLVVLPFSSGSMMRTRADIVLERASQLHRARNDSRFNVNNGDGDNARGVEIGMFSPLYRERVSSARHDSIDDDGDAYYYDEAASRSRLSSAADSTADEHVGFTAENDHLDPDLYQGRAETILYSFWTAMALLSLAAYVLSISRVLSAANGALQPNDEWRDSATQVWLIDYGGTLVGVWAMMLIEVPSAHVRALWIVLSVVLSPAVAFPYYLLVREYRLHTRIDEERPYHNIIADAEHFSAYYAAKERELREQAEEVARRRREQNLAERPFLFRAASFLLQSPSNHNNNRNNN